MNPNEDEFAFNESNDAELSLWELQLEMVRLQAEIDQLSAAARDRAEEIAALKVRLVDLELCVKRIKIRHRKSMQIWVWLAMMYGAMLGLAFSYLTRS